MLFDNLVKEIPRYFPKLQIKYKNTSLLMKVLGFLLFFNKDFLTNFVTVIGNTIYFPNEENIKQKPISSAIALLHELIHIYDSSRINPILFSLLYLFPQILVLMFFPLLLISWKIAIFSLLFLLPLPAYFRMIFEKRAYLTSLYVLKKLSIKMSFSIDLNDQKQSFSEHFKTSSYYFMWPFKNINNNFDDALIKINNGERPFEDKIFDILDELISNS